MFGLEILAHLYFFSLACFRGVSDAAHSRFRYGDPKQFLPDFLKMLVLALRQIYTRVFHLWNSIDLDSAWVRDYRPCEFSFLSRVFARLAMRHTRVFGVGISNYAYTTF